MMKTILMVAIVLYLLFTGVTTAQARPDDMTMDEWREFSAEDEVASVVKEPVVSKVTVNPTPEPEPDPDDFYCMGSHINHKIFWIPTDPKDCLERGLTQIPMNEGDELFCKLGYFGPADEWAVVPTTPDNPEVAGWDRCWSVAGVDA